MFWFFYFYCAVFSLVCNSLASLIQCLMCRVNSIELVPSVRLVSFVELVVAFVPLLVCKYPPDSLNLIRFLFVFLLQLEEESFNRHHRQDQMLPRLFSLSQTHGFKSLRLAHQCDSAAVANRSLVAKFCSVGVKKALHCHLVVHRTTDVDCSSSPTCVIQILELTSAVDRMV